MSTDEDQHQQTGLTKDEVIDLVDERLKHLADDDELADSVRSNRRDVLRMLGIGGLGALAGGGGSLAASEAVGRAQAAPGTQYSTLDEIRLDSAAALGMPAVDFGGDDVSNVGVESFADSAADPASNGEIQRNGTDIIAYSGGSARNLSNIGSGGGSGLTDDTHVFNETGSVANGDAGVVLATQLPDGSDFEVTQAGLIQADGTAAPNDLDLVIITMDNAGASTRQTIVIDGDGTLKNDETGAPLAEYSNDTGSTQTVALAVDNGQYNAGTGSQQDVVTEGQAEVV